MRRKIVFFAVSTLVLCLAFTISAEKKGKAPNVGVKKKTSKRPSIEAVYEKYKPDFLKKKTSEVFRGGKPPKELLKLSAETTFYTKSFVEISSRANALVKAGMEKEEKGDYRLALDIYQQVIDKFPDTLYRVNPYGIYVPISYYCQLRILNFPKEDLKFYREKNDARAREVFEVSRQKNSLEGLAHIRDNMLCTSYGSKSMLVLGDAELDRGHYLAALEYFTTVKKYFPAKEVYTPELTLKIAFCRKMLGEKVSIQLPKNSAASKLGSKKLKAFYDFIKNSQVNTPELFSQKSSPGCITADDYVHMPATTDPYAIKPPVWKQVLPASQGDYHVRFHPVVTGKSAIYRHKNVIYCRSILNGELRWKNDLGGRVNWQASRRYYTENVIVHDGMVFTPMYKNGPTMMALDEMTGQLKWSYGPMSASTEEEALMRFKTAPTAGPSTVYAGYYLDNIGSGVHIDTEYGVIAFESRTGRVKWRRKVCTLRPGKFAVSFGSGIRLRVRSFVTPPLYHQGTVYYCSSAGSIAALDALSGRVKWLTKYPYYIHPNDIHDATRGFGGRSTYIHPSSSLWLNQRPLVIGDDLYVLPVDSKFMYKMDRRTGKLLWSHQRREQLYRLPHSYGSPNVGGVMAWFMGPVRTGQLLFTYSFRGRKGQSPGGTFLVKPENGGVAWASPDPVAQHTEHPTLMGVAGMQTAGRPARFSCLNVNTYQFQVTARPFLTTNEKLYITSIGHGGYYVGDSRIVNLGIMDLKKKKVLEKRRFYLNGESQATCENAIRNAAYWAKQTEAGAKRNKKAADIHNRFKRVAEDTVPQNEYPGFLPFSRVTFRRYNTPFELRVTPREISMLYDLEKVKQTVAADKRPENMFADAELAIAEDRLEGAATLMESCLKNISPEDLGFRYLVNQQLYRVYRRLARGSIRKRDAAGELTYVTGMSRSSTTLEDEIQTLFAIADVYEHKNEFANASKYLKGIISKYGGYEYGVSSMYTASAEQIKTDATDAVQRTQKYVKGLNVEDLLSRSMGYAARSLPLYYSAVSPAERNLRVRCEQVAVSRLLSMQSGSDSFKTAYEKSAVASLDGKDELEQMNRLIEFPGTAVGQKTLKKLLQDTSGKLTLKAKDTAAAAELRKQLWRLADIARLCNFSLSEDYRKRILAPSEKEIAALKMPLNKMELDMEEKRGPSWLALERRGQLDVRPELLFLGAWVKKKFDNKFLLYAVDTTTGKTVWKAAEKRGQTWFDEIRLKGKGNEAGFFETFVYGDVVVVHGLFDVLAFNLTDGKLKWRYRVPFNFEIKHTVMSGDLLTLAGESETLTLYLPTQDPAGEVAWQVKEQGDLYRPPYYYKDRLVSVRMMPFSVTIRYRSTGKLIGRLEMDDLTLREGHPLLDKRPPQYPMSRDGKFLALCGGGYYILLDIEAIKQIWKRKMDVTPHTPIRMVLDGDYLAIIKKDYDVEAIYMISSKTGSVLWRTNPKNPTTPRPLFSMIISNGRLYGIKKHPGQGFYFTGMDCKTGKDLFRPNEQKGYQSIPVLRLRRAVYGDKLVAEIRDRQDFELKTFDMKTGKLLDTVKVKGLGSLGQHGRASATVQNGCLVLHGKNMVKIAAP